MTESKVLGVGVSVAGRNRIARLGLLRTAIAALLGGVATATVPTAALAQDGASPSLEEVTVTARKREERLQDLPISVSAFSSRDLDNMGLRDIAEIAQFTPGFSMQNVGATTEQPFIRGMAVTSFDRNLQTASSFQDGVYSSMLGRTLFLDDVERVEVVKGPQSALFGRATFAGAINYIAKKPTAEPQGLVRATYGEYGLAELHGSYSAPVIDDTLLFRVSANSRAYEGAYSNPGDGEPLGDEDHSGYTAALTWMPTDSVKAELRWLDTQFRDRGQQPQYIQPASTNNCYPNTAGVPQYFCGEIQPTEQWLGLNLDLVGGAYTRLDQQRGVLDLSWDAGPVTLGSVSFYGYQKSRTFCDCDYSSRVPLAGAFHSLFDTTVQNLSQEIRIESNGEGIRWLAGLYWFREESVTGRVNTAVPPTLPHVTVTNRAAFAGLSFPIGEDFTLDVDLRSQRERQERTAIPGNAAVDVEYKATLPRAIVSWRVNPAVLTYASASKGSQPGQFNTGANIPNELVKVDEQKLWSYEVGAKTTWWDDRLTLNGSAYYMDWSGQVYSTQVTGTDGRLINVLANLGSSRVKGVELESVARLSDSISMRLGYSYVDAAYTDFISPNALRVYGDAQVAGKRFPNTPRSEFLASLSYSQPVSWGKDASVFGQLDYQWRGRQTLAEVDDAYIGDLSLVNLRGGVALGRFRLTVAVENLFDADTPEFATRFSDLNTSPFRFGYLVNLREPRRMSLTASYAFGGDRAQ